MSTQSRNKSSIKGRVEAKLYSNDDLVETCPEWEELPDEEKLEATREVEPIETVENNNVTAYDMHAYFVRNLSGNSDGEADNVNADWFSVGTGGNLGTSPANEDLNERVYEKRVTAWSENEDERNLRISTLLGSNEADGYEIDELGLFSGDPDNLIQDEVFILNHAEFEPITKSSENSLTFEVTLEFTNA